MSEAAENPAFAVPPLADAVSTPPVLLVPAEPLERLLGYFVEFLPITFISALIPVIGPLLVAAYVLLRDGLFPGESVGKKLLKTQVIVRATGLPATYRESIIRNSPLALSFVFYIIPIIGHLIGGLVGIVVLIVEIALIFTDPQHRRLGDKLADTIVVKLPSPKV